MYHVWQTHVPCSENQRSIYRVLHPQSHSLTCFRFQKEIGQKIKNKRAFERAQMCRFTTNIGGLFFVMEPIHSSTVVVTARYCITLNISVYKNKRELPFPMWDNVYWPEPGNQRCRVSAVSNTLFSGRNECVILVLQRGIRSRPFMRRSDRDSFGPSPSLL